MLTIKIVDSGCDRYTIEADCRCLGRMWDNVAEEVTIVKPDAEIGHSCTMIVVNGGEVIDQIVVGDEPIKITSNLSQYQNVKIGFSFMGGDYVKNSEAETFYFAPAIKPEDFVPVEPETKAQLNKLLSLGFAKSVYNSEQHQIEYYNLADELVQTLDVTPFITDQKGTDVTVSGQKVDTFDADTKQDKLTAGDRITIIDNTISASEETDPTVPQFVKDITEQDITNWNAKIDQQGLADYTYDKQTIDDAINDLDQDFTDLNGRLTDAQDEIETNTADIATNRGLINANTQNIATLTLDSAHTLDVTMDTSTFVLTFELKNKAGTVLSSAKIDLPLETMVIGASYKSGILTLTLKNGQTLDIDISSIVGGLVTQEDFNNEVDRLDGEITTLQGNDATQDLLLTSIEEQNKDRDTKINSVETKVNENIQSIADVENKISPQASSTNPAMDKDFINSSISNMAAHYLTKDDSGSPFNSYAELDSATTFYYGQTAFEPTEHDYVTVMADESQKADELGNYPTTRYTYQNGVWALAFIVNNTAFTAAQVKTLNSGITAENLAELQTETTKLKDEKVSKSGDIMTGSLDFQLDNLHVQLPTTDEDYDEGLHLGLEGNNNLPGLKNYISAGSGYGRNAGKNGIKLFACEQSNVQTGMGQDLCGKGYELDIVTSENTNSTNGNIVFCKHTNLKDNYAILGYFNVNGEFFAEANKKVATEAWVNAIKAPAYDSVTVQGMSLKPPYYVNSMSIEDIGGEDTVYTIPLGNVFPVKPAISATDLVIFSTDKAVCYGQVQSKTDTEIKVKVMFDMAKPVRN